MTFTFNFNNTRWKSNKMSIDETPVPPPRRLSCYTTVPEAVLMSDNTSSEEDSDSDYDSGDEYDEYNAAEKYGYGDASPDTVTKKTCLPKRLSTRANSIRRRHSSICRHKQKLLSLTEHYDVFDENLLPFDPQRAPQRSSIKGSCPQRTARAALRRRASISTCTTESIIEEELATGIISQPLSQVLEEIQVPLSQVLEISSQVDPGLRRRRDSSIIKRRTTSITFNKDVDVRIFTDKKEQKNNTCLNNNRKKEGSRFEWWCL